MLKRKAPGGRKVVDVMRWDLGPGGLAVLIGMSVAFGLVARFVVRTATRWLWLIAAAGYFLGGLFISEVWFGWATEAELQPNIDGLSFDEVLLIGLIPGIATVLLARYVARRRRSWPAEPASDSDKASTPRLRG